MPASSNNLQSPTDTETLKSTLITVVVFGLLYALYESWLVSQLFYKEYLEFCTALASTLLNQYLGEQSVIANLSPGMPLELRSHDAAYIRVTKGSEGGLFALVLIAVIMGQPCAWFKKLFGLILGLTLIFCLSIARICALFKVDIFYSRHFYIMSDFLLPAVFCLVVVAYYYCWLHFFCMRGKPHSV